MLNIFRYNYIGEDELNHKRQAGGILPAPHIKANIWAIGGGKGGVGKSLITSSLGILLSRLGKKVLLIDADLGAANLHTFMGTEGSKSTISGFLKGECSDIENVISRTPIPNLELISGAKDPLNAADLSGSGITRLREALKKVSHDYVLLDIGPGTSSNMLDLFLLADEGIVITTAEPTSIENTYRFIKCLLMRKLRKIVDAEESGVLKGLVQQVFSKQGPQRLKTFSDMFDQLIRLDRERGERLRHLLIKDARVSVIINQIRRTEDKEMGPSVRLTCYHYFGLEVGYLGYIHYDDRVGDSIRSRKPLAVHYSDSQASKAIEACLDRLFKKEINK